MPDNNLFAPLERNAWLLEIGRRLKADYEALREPVPERLARLVRLAEDRCRAQDVPADEREDLVSGNTGESH